MDRISGPVVISVKKTAQKSRSDTQRSIRRRDTNEEKSIRKKGVSDGCSAGRQNRATIRKMGRTQGDRQSYGTTQAMYGGTYYRKAKD